MPGGRRALRYSLRLPLEAYSTITYRGPIQAQVTTKRCSNPILNRMYVMYIKLKYCSPHRLVCRLPKG